MSGAAAPRPIEHRASAPRDDRGRFVTTACPNSGCDGKLVLETSGTYRGLWLCDGLADPENPNLPLVACDYAFKDGETAHNAVHGTGTYRS